MSDAPAAPQDLRRQAIQHALDTISRSLDLYKSEELAFSFNGGKDSTAVLHLLLAAVQRWRTAQGQTWQPEDGLLRMHVFFFESPEEFPEVVRFVRDSDARHHLRLQLYTSGFKDGVQQMLQERPIRAIFLGTRHGDPNCKDQDYFCPSSKGWPPFMRINPILNWSYSDVWHYLREAGARYCDLYDRGYTSLGSVRDTVPNAALLRPDGSYAPAHQLSDDRLERSGRHLPNIQRQHSKSAGLAHTAAIVAIGDELLTGKVSDTNSAFIAKELHRLGWAVSKMVIVPDNVEVIARELEAAMDACDMVFTCGGLGPTVDDCTIEAVAMACGTHVTTDAALADALRSYFGEQLQESHLKMAQVPENCSELVPQLDTQGNTSPFPLLIVRNAVVLPGVPALLQAKWPGVARRLTQQFGANSTRYHNRVLRLKVGDEARIAGCFEALVQEFPDVAAGSYPSFEAGVVSSLTISFEAKGAAEVAEAAERFKALLDALPDPQLRAGACVVSESVDTDRLTRRSTSVDAGS